MSHPNDRPGARSLWRRTSLVLLAVVAVLGSLLGTGEARASSAADDTAPGVETVGAEAALQELPAPEAPDSLVPTQPAAYVAPVLRRVPKPKALRTLSSAAAVAAPASADTWGDPAGPASTLVVYDTGGDWGHLGELYALAVGNLATHFGTVTAEPVTDYVAGQVEEHTATIYLGSTYNEAIPLAFLQDVVSTMKPVLWAGYNIWQLSGTGDDSVAFAEVYGWNPWTSFLDSRSFAAVTYGSTALTRNPLAGAILAPTVTDPELVSVLASATVAGTTDVIPWAIRSENLTYIGEIPFSYMTESDRYLAVADLLYDALDPAAPAARRALVRIEDVSPGASDPTELRAIADYLASAGVPFSVGVIASYEDPNGAYNDGVPERLDISQVTDSRVSSFNQALLYMQSKGGTLLQHGTTHQWSDQPNPYNGVSADDFEFYRSRCSSTPTEPYDFRDGCLDTDWVISLGALPDDSSSWARDRALTGRRLFTAAGLAVPTIWETPHYAASAADYAGIGEVYPVRYERTLYFSGQLGGAPTGTVFGQLFPYVVHDRYGTTLLPESLGNLELEAMNHNLPRTAGDVVANAAAVAAVRQGVASFFFHSYYPVSELRTIVEGIKALGFDFVAANDLLTPAERLSITTAVLPAGSTSSAYTATLTATGGTAPYTWSIVAGALPEGLTLDGGTGTISGTPTSDGTFELTVGVVDAAGASRTMPLTLSVASAPLALTTTSLPGAQVGTPYSATLTATGGTTPYTWSIAAGSLPAGLTLDRDTGVISGTPTRQATTYVTFRVTDSASPAATRTARLRLSVTIAKLTITTASLPAATTGTDYSATLEAVGGVPPYRWSISSGSLPSGLRLDSSTGVVSGTPTRAGSSTVTFRVRDSRLFGPSDTQRLTMTVSAGPLAVTTTSLPSVGWFSLYSTTLEAAGGTTPYRWTIVSGSLPSGLSLNSSRGVISGFTWRRPQTSTLTFRVTDSSSPAGSATVTLTLPAR